MPDMGLGMEVAAPDIMDRKPHDVGPKPLHRLESYISNIPLAQSWNLHLGTRH
jgi:hypothetical protein